VIDKVNAISHHCFANSPPIADDPIGLTPQQIRCVLPGGGQQRRVAKSLARAHEVFGANARDLSQIGNHQIRIIRIWNLFDERQEACQVATLSVASTVSSN
jgi:hypothetical protein